MAFDWNSNRPLVVLRKWTTKINLGIAVGVGLFLIFGMLLISFWSRRTPAVAASPAPLPAAASTKP